MTRIVLRDGRVAELREARSTEADIDMIADLFRRASANSLYFRFFHAVQSVSRKTIESLVAFQRGEGLSLLCVAGRHALGIGTMTRTSEDTAEVSFLVEDDLHGKGLGTLLLEHLAQAGWRLGMRRFEAYVLHENTQMMNVFRSSGYEITGKSRPDCAHLVLPLGETERSRALQETREKLATAASLVPFFRPTSIAVVGASRNQQQLGYLLFRHILDSSFHGTAYPVNPNAHAVSGVRAYPTVTAIRETIDLAIVVVPANRVLQVVDECVEAHVRGVILISAGFSETGQAGLELEQEVVRRLRAGGCRLIGPNSLGLLNTSPHLEVNASLVPTFPPHGGMSIASQSGGLGITIAKYANQMGLGISSLVSMGNKADVSSNDLLLYWEDDVATQLVVMYIESFGNPARFSRIARRITRQKPILAMKSARTSAGLMASDSRMVATAAKEPVVDALFYQTGIIRLDTLQELFDVAALLLTSPIPNGNRVAIVTNTSGGAVMTIDALRREGLEFVSPVIDLGTEALAEGYRTVLPQVLRDDSVDAVIVLFIPVGVVEESPVAEAIAEAIREVQGEGGMGCMGEDEPNPRFGKPVVSNFLAHHDYLVRYIDAEGQRVPIYPFPEQAVRALAKAIGYGHYLSQPQGHIPDLPNMDTGQVRSLIRAEQKPESYLLPRHDADRVFKWIGLACDDAPFMANTPNLEVSDGFNDLQQFLVGTVAKIAVKMDPLFGPVLWLHTVFVPGRNLGLSEALVRLVPLTDLEAQNLVESFIDQCLIEQESGSVGGQHMQRENDAAVDKVHTPEVKTQTLVSAVTDIVLRISRLVEEVPEIEDVSLHFQVTQELNLSVFQPEIRLAAHSSIEGLYL